MMRLLFLCVLLLLPAATVLSEDLEGSADASDDEDFAEQKNIPNVKGSQAETEGSKENPSQMTVIVIAAVVAVVALSVIAVAAVMLMKRQKLKQQQGLHAKSDSESQNQSVGVYSVPTEQNEKGTI